MGVDVREYHLPHILFVQMAGMTSHEIHQIPTMYDCAKSTSIGYPVFGMMKALNSERRRLLQEIEMIRTGITPEKEVQITNLELDLKQEVLLSKRILNQVKLGYLIPKEEAQGKIENILRSVMSLIKAGIKTASVRALNIQTQRDIETIMYEEWNKAIDELESAAEKISWECDGSTNLLQTKLSQFEREDPEFAAAVKERYISGQIEDQSE